VQVEGNLGDFPVVDMGRETNEKRRKILRARTTPLRSSYTQYYIIQCSEILFGRFFETTASSRRFTQISPMLESCESIISTRLVKSTHFYGITQTH
jgi:hypothetical protein